MKSKTFPLVIAFKEITKEMDIILGRGVHKLYADLLDVGEAVHDTRNFKHSFVAPKQIEPYKWRIQNTADYSVVLSQGRHTVNGKEYGSKKWQHGLDPMLVKLGIQLEKEFDKVKK